LSTGLVQQVVSIIIWGGRRALARKR
jgi:hypothetical protein